MVQVSADQSFYLLKAAVTASADWGWYSNVASILPPSSIFAPGFVEERRGYFVYFCVNKISKFFLIFSYFITIKIKAFVKPWLRHLNHYVNQIPGRLMVHYYQLVNCLYPFIMLSNSYIYLACWHKVNNHLDRRQAWVLGPGHRHRIQVRSQCWWLNSSNLLIVI